MKTAAEQENAAVFFIAIFKNSPYQNSIFAICSLRMLLVHEKRKLLYLQIALGYASRRLSKTSFTTSKATCPGALA